jgi:hypothetical protein
MKTTIKLLFTIVLLMAISKVQAQSHTFATGWCKLAKSGGVKGESASLECQACNAKDKKEIEAKNVENKRRDDAIVAKAKAEKEAYENARKAKQVEDAKKANTGKVYINGNTIIADKTSTPVKQEKPKTTEKDYFYTKSGPPTDLQYYFGYGVNDGFVVNDIKVLNSNQFKNYFGPINKETNTLNFPANIGIVILNNERTLPSGKKLAISDIVDINGKRILNDDNITAILHFVDDYFILCKGNYSSSFGYPTVFEDVIIFNFKTKEAYPVWKGVSRGNKAYVKMSTSIFPPSDYRTDLVTMEKGTYKAFIWILGDTKEIFYYINNNGIIKEQHKNY